MGVTKPFQGDGHHDGPRSHGGPDALGVPRFDFSTNSNACGPCPAALAALRQSDPSRYPDPEYTTLLVQLAAFHGVEAARIVLAGSASEFIYRITAWVAQAAQQGPKRAGRSVCVPQHAYGDYVQAAQAWGLRVMHDTAGAKLVWCCEPSSPLGQAHAPWPASTTAPVVLDADALAALPVSGPADAPADAPAGAPADASAVAAPVVLDCAYAPLRLSGAPSLATAQWDRVWQLWSPNKALGLTGVRGAYAIAPLGAMDAARALDALAPSWPLGAHGVALLQAWVQPEAQSWLADSLHTLRRWKARQIDLLQALGWTCLPSDSNFFCAQGDGGGWTAELGRLRTAGIKLRDAASFGLPGHARLSVQPPVAQDALRRALQGS